MPTLKEFAADGVPLSEESGKSIAFPDLADDGEGTLWRALCVLVIGSIVMVGRAKPFETISAG
jgi:hypothetical protein